MRTLGPRRPISAARALPGSHELRLAAGYPFSHTSAAHRLPSATTHAPLLRPQIELVNLLCSDQVQPTPSSWCRAPSHSERSGSDWRGESRHGTGARFRLGGVPDRLGRRAGAPTALARCPVPGGLGRSRGPKCNGPNIPSVPLPSLLPSLSHAPRLLFTKLSRFQPHSLSSLPTLHALRLTSPQPTLACPPNVPLRPVCPLSRPCGVRLARLRRD